MQKDLSAGSLDGAEPGGEHDHDSSELPDPAEPEEPGDPAAPGSTRKSAQNLKQQLTYLWRSFTQFGE